MTSLVALLLLEKYSFVLLGDKTTGKHGFLRSL